MRDHVVNIAEIEAHIASNRIEFLEYFADKIGTNLTEFDNFYMNSQTFLITWDFGLAMREIPTSDLIEWIELTT